MHCKGFRGSLRAGTVRIGLRRVVLLVFLLGRKILEHCVKQIARSVTVYGRHLNRVAQSEIIELIEVGRRLSDTVALVDAQHNGNSAL